MSGVAWSAATAAWMGLLCAISPCPLASSIAAVGFLARRASGTGKALADGVAYALGRTLAYAGIGALLSAGLAAASPLSHLLQKHLNMLLGPLLVIMAAFLLDLIRPPFHNGAADGSFLQRAMARLGALGPLFLGMMFALSFCPASAAIYFGGLLPMMAASSAPLLLSCAFGIATGLPVLLFACLLVFCAEKVGNTLHCLSSLGKWFQQATGTVFLALGVWLTILVTLGL
jgi:cytochrome c biogenesis protein CcdA